MDPSDHLYNISYTRTLKKNPKYHLTNIETYSLFQPQESGCYGELRYIQQRNKEELLHEDWMRQRRDLEKKVEEKMEGSMKVRSGDNCVKFIYKCKGHKVLGATIFRFKITLMYHSLLRKWYISPGYSFVPEVIDLKSKLKSGTYHPFSEEVFDVIHDVRHLIDVFMIRLTTVYQIVHDVQKKYKDVQFNMNAIITKMKLTFTDNAWPSDLQKSNIKDMIIVELKLNKNIEVCNIAYKYIYQKTQTKARINMKENLNKLQSKLQNFLNFPLKEAIERFITEEERYTSLQEQGSPE